MLKKKKKKKDNINNVQIQSMDALVLATNWHGTRTMKTMQRQEKTKLFFVIPPPPPPTW